MGLLLNRVKENTATTGTGSVTPSGAVAPYQTWSAGAAVSGQWYSYLIEDGAAWEVGTGLYNGTTISRPGPTNDPSFASSTGALLNLTGSATISCVENVMNVSGPALISSQSVSGVSSIVYDSTKITPSYDTYEIKFEGVTPAAATTFMVQLSPDNGVTWRTTGYLSAREIWGLTTNFSNYAMGGVTTGLILIGDSTTDAARPQNGYARLHNLLSATKLDMMQGDHIGKASDNNVYDFRTAGMYNTATEAHNAIRIVPTAATTFSGKFQLYGLP